MLLLIPFSAPLLRSQAATSSPAPSFDAVAATNAYLAAVPANKKARSDAYFEVGYWLILWDFLYCAARALLLLTTRFSSRMRSLAERLQPIHQAHGRHRTRPHPEPGARQWHPRDGCLRIDAYRQSTRISANVCGFLGTERITLNDNLLKRSTLPEIMSVMGHEMGHYVLNHVYKGLVFTLMVLVVFFAGLRRVLDWSLTRWDARWEIRGVTDHAVLPLAVLIRLDVQLPLHAHRQHREAHYGL